MNPPDSQAIRESAGAGWRRPQGETVGLERYFRILRERAGLIGLVVLVTTLIAAAYLAVATEQYRAEADLLVIPGSRSQTALDGLPIIRETSDPTRDVETASKVVTSRNVAKRVIDDLGLDKSVDEILKQVKAEPIAQSSIVAIRPPADSPELARDIANGFADGVVTSRDEVVRAEAEKLISGLRTQLQDAQQTGDDTTPTSLSDAIAELQSVRAGGDPTLSVETRADAPESAYSPRPMLT